MEYVYNTDSITVYSSDKKLLAEVCFPSLDPISKFILLFAKLFKNELWTS